ncbi:hypothetical protein [Methyloglobulus sp.]|uniref:hypothetical protein n=1 Tax=Methyloglobulus sp. TaxID=2518622 RepID=UPI0032B85149
MLHSNSSYPPGTVRVSSAMDGMCKAIHTGIMEKIMRYRLANGFCQSKNNRIAGGLIWLPSAINRMGKLQ